MVNKRESLLGMVTVDVFALHSAPEPPELVRLYRLPLVVDEISNVELMKTLQIRIPTCAILHTVVYYSHHMVYYTRIPPSL